MCELQVGYKYSDNLQRTEEIKLRLELYGNHFGLMKLTGLTSFPPPNHDAFKCLDICSFVQYHTFLLPSH